MFKVPHPAQILDLKPCPNEDMCMIRDDSLVLKTLYLRDTSFDNDHVWNKVVCHKHRIVADCSPRYAKSSSVFPAEILSGVSFTSGTLPRYGVMKVDQDSIDESPQNGGSKKKKKKEKHLHFLNK